MAKTKIGIVYADNSKIIRRIIVPDDDSDLDRSNLLGTGEKLHKVNLNHGTDLATVKQTIKNLTGTDPPSGRCAVINGGTVVGVIMADPSIDALPGYTLVLSDTAGIGWTWTPGGGFAPS